MNIIDYKNKDVNISFKEIIKKAHDLQNDYNSFVTICETMEYNKSDSLLDGVPYALKDNFSTKGILTTASSNILKNYVPIYNSTVYEKLLSSGAVLVGKTVLDELAMGGMGTTGHTGIVKNPLDTSRIIGGSSAGSAASVCAGIVPFAIGSDTGDSVRKPASYAGLVGFKPTYGRISRYGLFPFASTLDHVGVFANTVKDASIVTDAIKGYDPKDMTSIKEDDESYYLNIDKEVKGKRLFCIKEIINVDTNNFEVKENINNFNNLINKIKELGIEVCEVSFDKNLLNALVGIYYSISCAEATSNNSNLTGIHFGQRKDGDDYKSIMINSRTEGFSELIKRRFILGSYILKRENQEKLYLNALRARRIIVDKFNELFNEFDGLILPASGGIAPKIGENNDNKISEEYLTLENHLVIANLGGYPSITIPYGYIDNLPIGVNITCGQFKDSLTLNLAHKIENIIDFKRGENHV